MLSITLFLASALPIGMPGAIYYSWSLIMFPVGALGTAAATAIFPTLSRMSALDDLNAVRRTVNRTLRLIVFLALPAAVGLIMLRNPIVDLLYHHGGQWTALATDQTAFALLFYALALAPLSLIEVLARVFYAMKDTVTPVRIALVAVTIDAVLSVLFVHLLPPSAGQGGLALATALATAVQAVWLANTLDGALESIGREGLLLTVRDTGLASLVMALVLYLTLGALTAVLAQTGFGLFVTVAVEIALGAGTFVLATYVLGAPELWEVRSFVLGTK
jgi:putative peptidoglycan lipid II flippase